MSPKFGELLATDVWAAATRTLTDISAEEIFDLPEFDSVYPNGLATSSGTANTFGSWGELSADIGEGKRLVAVAVSISSGLNAGQTVEIEIGEGESGSEAAVGRFNMVGFAATRSRIYYLWLALSDNARISARAKDEDAAANPYNMTLMVA